MNKGTNEQSFELRLLRNILRDLKWIVLVTVIVAAVGAVVLLRIPNVYETESALIVQEVSLPVNNSDIKWLDLDTQMVSALAQSNEIRAALFNKCRSHNLIEDEMKFREFVETISSRVTKKISRDMGLTPYIRLAVRHKESTKASEIANLWASMIYDKCNKLVVKKKGSLWSAISNVADDSRDNWVESRDALTSVTVDAQMDSLRSKSQYYGKELGIQMGKRLALQSEKNNYSIQLRKLSERVKAHEVDGKWIGDAWSESQYSKEGEELDNDSLSTQSQRVLNDLTKIETLENQLNELEEKRNSELSDAKLLALEKSLAEVTESLSASKKKLASSESKLSAIEKATSTSVSQETSKNGKKRFLSRGGDSVGDDEVDLFLLSPEEQKDKLTVLIAGLGAEVNLDNESFTALENDATSLSAAIVRNDTDSKGLRERLKRLKSQYDRSLGLYTGYLDEYTSVSLAYANVIEQEQYATKSLDGLEDRQNEISKEIAEWSGKIVKKSLDERVKSGSYESMSRKAEDYALINSLTSDSLHGVSVFYQAEADEVKVSPKRARIMLLLVIAAAFFHLLFIAMRTLLEEQVGE